MPLSLRETSAIGPRHGEPWAEAGAGKAGWKRLPATQKLTAAQPLACCTTPNVRGLKITQLLCQSRRLIRLGGVENTCYIQAMIGKAHHGAEDLPWICNQQVAGWVPRTQKPAPGSSQVKAKSTTLRRKASCPLYRRPRWH